jgi:hypothetical protein
VCPRNWGECVFFRDLDSRDGNIGLGRKELRLMPTGGGLSRESNHSWDDLSRLEFPVVRGLRVTLGRGRRGDVTAVAARDSGRREHDRSGDQKRLYPDRDG